MTLPPHPHPSTPSEAVAEWAALTVPSWFPPGPEAHLETLMALGDLTSLLMVGTTVMTPGWALEPQGLRGWSMSNSQSWG